MPYGTAKNLNKLKYKRRSFISALKFYNNDLCHQFFYQEIGGIFYNNV